MAAILIQGRAAKGRRPPMGTFGLNRNSAQSSGLVGWWPMGTGKRSIEMTQGLNATFNGSGFDNNATFGGCPTYNGATTMTIADAAYPQYDFGGSYSISAWFYITGAGTGYMVGSHRDAAAAANGVYSFGLTTNKLYTNIVSGGAFRSTIGATTLSTFTPYLGVGVFDDENNEQRVYVNGKQDAITTSFTFALTAASKTVRWGGFGGAGAPDVFAGQIADGRLYNRALTDREVWAMYDPATRWELYWTPSRRVTFTPVAAVTTGLSPFLAASP